MKSPVTYVLAFSGIAGGVKVVLTHAAGLRRRGWDCCVFSVEGRPAWFGDDALDWRQFPNTDALGAALRQRTGVKVGTYVPHWSWVSENLNPGDAGYGLLQDFDGATYSGRPDLDAAAVRRLKVITEGDWVTAEVKRRYGVEAVNVGIGLDPLYHRPLPMVRHPLRVLAPARGHGLKGWDTVAAAMQEVVQSVPGVGLVSFGPQPCGQVPGLPHIHLTNPNDRKLRELYCSAGVFVSGSRHEGFGLPMAEAMAGGAPVACTDANGNREFCRHEDTCLLSPPGDAGALAANIVRLLTAPRLAERLAENARAEVGRYWWPAVIDRLEALFAGAPAASL